MARTAVSTLANAVMITTAAPASRRSARRSVPFRSGSFRSTKAQSNALRLCPAPRLGAGGGARHAVSLQGEGLLQSEPHAFLIVDDEDGEIPAAPHASSLRGNQSVTVVPTSSSPVTAMVPPCCFMIVWLRARPSPVP